MPILLITRAQGNLMLEALAERPFKQVFEVIGVLNRQAEQFVAAQAQAAGNAIEARDARAAFTLSASELRLTLEALGDLPYRRVQPLLQDLHAQLAQQTLAAGPEDA